MPIFAPPPFLRINGKRVVVQFDNPPIPVREFDFSAVFIDEYEPGDIIGRGETAVEALVDLKEQDDERSAPN